MSGNLELPLGIYVPERAAAFKGQMEITEHAMEREKELFSCCFSLNFLTCPYLNT